MNLWTKIHISSPSTGTKIWTITKILHFNLTIIPHLHIPIHHTRQRPYLRKHTWSRPIPAVKSERAWLVLGWVTAWEHRVPLAYPFAFCFQILNYCSFIILLFYLKVIKIYIKPPLMRIISTSNYNRPPQITQKSNIRSLLKVGQLCCDRSGPVYQLTRE